MNLPTDLLQALVANGGGRITLITGAGTSLDEPTCVPLASTCSTRCYQELIADHVLAEGDCADSENLSLLADVVFAKTGAQTALVERLKKFNLQTASPNSGHLTAVALLAEGALASILTLNFDLALTGAIAFLGIPGIGIVNGPDELSNQATRTVYYLHGNANTGDANRWVLRTAPLAAEWRDSWQVVVTARVLATPIVVFAGLGSPASVLVDTSKRIRDILGAGNQAFQVDPGDVGSSPFFSALSIPEANYLKTTWSDFMDEMSKRVVIDQVARLSAAASEIIRQERLHAEDLTALLVKLRAMPLVELGSLRGQWLLHPQKYMPDEPLAAALMGDLVAGIAMVERESGCSAIPASDGVLEFHRGKAVASVLLVASGRGTRSVASLEPTLSSRAKAFRTRGNPPTGAIVANTRLSGPLTPPQDVAFGDTNESILYEAPLQISHFDELRADASLIRSVAP